MIRATARWRSMAAKPRFISVAGGTTSCCSPLFRTKRRLRLPENRARGSGRNGKRGQTKDGGNRLAGSTRSEIALIQHDMYAFAAVHNLGDTQIGGKAQQRIGLITIETSVYANQIDHQPQRDDDAVIEVGVERHGDHMRGRFGERPFEAHIVANCEPERPNKPSFNGGDANLTVALRAMSIAHGKKGAIIENGKIQSGASDKFFVIEISAVLAWRQRSDPAPFQRRCD